jgi:hypothetical protein
MSKQLHYIAYGEQNFERVESPAYRSTFHFRLHLTAGPTSLFSEDKPLVLPVLRVRTHYFHNVYIARVSAAALTKSAIISLDYRQPKNICTRQQFAVTEYW